MTPRSRQRLLDAVFLLGALAGAFALPACKGAASPNFPQRDQGPGKASWQAAIDALAKTLVDKLRLTGPGPLRVAVFSFTTVDDKPCDLGANAADRLAVTLFESDKLRIIERERLKDVLTEQNVSTGDKVDLKTAARLGRLAGAEAIVIGSIKSASDGYDVYARVVAVESAEVISMANVQAAKASAEEFGTCGPTAAIGQSGLAGAGAANAVYYQDFSSVPDGTLPPNWMGGTNLVADHDARKRFLRFFQGQRDSITIPDLPFPSDFAVEVRLRFATDTPQFSVTVGKMKLMLRGGPFGDQQSIRLNEARAETGDLKGKDIAIVLEKRGDVFRGFVNGAQTILARYPNFALPSALELGFDFWSSGDPKSWRIYSIAVRDLGAQVTSP